MSDLIRMMSAKMSIRGLCNKCGLERSTGSHSKCDTWPTTYGTSRGFHMVGNSDQSTLAELKKLVDSLCLGESPDTVVRFDLKIMQVPRKDNEQKKN